jgi:hypothetical protein
LRYLVIAPLSDDVAIRVFLRLKARHGADQVTMVSSEELSMAPRWALRLDRDSAARSEIRLASGTILNSHAIGAVYQRIRYAQVPHFAGAATEDRDYAVSEMHALLLAWLSGLPCQVTNPPHPLGLGGWERRATEWLILGAEAGLHGIECEWSSDPDEAVRFRQTVGPERRSVLVAGDSVLGEPPDDQRAECVRLATLARCTLLEILFAPTDDGWRYCGATPYPGDPVRIAEALERIA